MVEAPDEILHSHITTDIPNSKKAMVQNIAPTAPVTQSTSMTKTISKLWGKIVSAFKTENVEIIKPTIKKVPYQKNNATHGRTTTNAHKLNNVIQSSSSTTNKRQTTVRPIKPIHNTNVINDPIPVITKPIVTQHTNTNAKVNKPQITPPRPASASQVSNTQNNQVVRQNQPKPQVVEQSPRVSSAEDNLHLLSNPELAPQKQTNSRQAPNAVSKRAEKPTTKTANINLNVNKNEQPILATTSMQQPPKKQQIVQVIEEIKPIRTRVVRVEVNPTPTAETKKVTSVKVKTSTPTKVDLGSLEMVATNKNLASVSNIIEVKPTKVKRYNDISNNKNKVAQEAIKYEIIETKHN